MISYSLHKFTSVENSSKTGCRRTLIMTNNTEKARQIIDKYSSVICIMLKEKLKVSTFRSIGISD